MSDCSFSIRSRRSGSSTTVQSALRNLPRLLLLLLLWGLGALLLPGLLATLLGKGGRP
jgi:hypothetical protein